MNPWFRKTKAVGVLWGLIILASCATVPTAQTFNQGFAYAEGLHTTILQSLTAAVVSGAISSGDASAVLVKADNAQALLLAAQAANAAGDASGSASSLQTAVAVLTSLVALVPGAQ